MFYLLRWTQQYRDREMLSTVVLGFVSIGVVKFIVNYIKSYSEQKRVDKFLANYPEPWKGNVSLVHG